MKFTILTLFESRETGKSEKLKNLKGEKEWRAERREPRGLVDEDEGSPEMGIGAGDGLTMTSA